MIGKLDDIAKKANTALNETKIFEGITNTLEAFNKELKDLDARIKDVRNEMRSRAGILNDYIKGVDERLGVIEAIEVRDGKDGIDGKKGDKGDQGDQGEKGEQGIAGLNGIDGIDGKDGIDGVDGKRGLKGLRGLRGFKGSKGNDGKDGSPDSADDIVDKLESLKGKDRLDAKAIKNLPVAVYGRQGGGGTGDDGGSVTPTPSEGGWVQWKVVDLDLDDYDQYNVLNEFVYTGEVTISDNAELNIMDIS